MKSAETGPAMPTQEDIREILSLYGIVSFLSCRKIDSSRGEDDIRWNYVIDNKYVLRINSCDVMTEDRLGEINALAGRYMEAGIQCPKYIASRSGAFLVRWAELYCYLSEYLDYELASEKDLRDEDKLDKEIQDFTAAFARKNRNIGLSEIMSMYSLFELCPYDQKAGIDEKQENLNALIEVLEELDCAELGRSLSDRNEAIRQELKGFYRQLPRCVFQGDENSTNVLIDEEEHFVGLIDFNMSGTEVIVNYLANNAGFCVKEKDLEVNEPENALTNAISHYRANMQRLLALYGAEETERRAAALYAYIILISSWPNVCCYRYGLAQKELTEKTRRLLERISELDVGRLYV